LREKGQKTTRARDVVLIERAGKKAESIPLLFWFAIGEIHFQLSRLPIFWIYHDRSALGVSYSVCQVQQTVSVIRQYCPEGGPYIFAFRLSLLFQLVFGLYEKGNIK